MPYLKNKNGDRREIIDTTKNGLALFIQLETLTDKLHYRWFTLESLLADGWEVIEDEKQTPWTPEVGQEYFTPDLCSPKEGLLINKDIWHGCPTDLHRLSLGIVCRTRAEAEAKYDEIIGLIKN